MNRYRFEIVLAGLLGLLLFGFCHWQSPGSRLSQAEIDACIERIDRLAPVPAEEKNAFLAHLRAWAEADDGRPVYNLNLMRYYPQLRKLPGVEIQASSPAEANAYYESQVKPLLLRLGVSIPFAGTAQPVLTGTVSSTNLIAYDSELDNWNRVLLVRYPSRRAFLELIANPDYLKVMPYKLASLLVVLTPVSGELVMPDPRLALGALFLCIVLAVGWLRAERRHGR